MAMAAESFNRVPNPELSRSDTFTIIQFEEDNLLLTQAAWGLHAKGYEETGFVKPSAIDPSTGRFPDDFDKSRGANTEYFLAQNPENQDYVATMRLVSPPPGGTYKDLPAYDLCKNGLRFDGRAQLAQGEYVKEVAALAGNPKAIYELLRHAIQQAIGKDELWLFSIVSTTHQALVDSFGIANLNPIGEDAQINDIRVNSDIRLRPALSRPDLFNDNLLQAYMQAESPRQKARLLRSFLFFTEGLDASKMSDSVLEARQSLLSDQQQRSQRSQQLGRLELRLTEKREQPDVWDKPVAFDLSTAVGRDGIERQLTNQDVVVRDSVDEIAQDLFEQKHPDQKGDSELRQQFVDQIKSQGARFGRWFLFPWSQELVRYPNKQDHRTLRTARNKNLITEDEQRRLYDTTILIGGLSVGSNVVRELVASGIGGTLILGDPDHISPTNLNRINGGFPDVGRKKLDHAAIQISEADPYIEQVHLREGITEDSIRDVERYRPHLMFDEVDDLRTKVRMREFAKRAGIPLVMVTDIGSRVLLDVERHDLGDVQPFQGRLSTELIESISDGSATPQEMRKAMVKIVGLRHVSTRMLQSFIEVGKTLPGIPQLGNTASRGGALGAMIAREIILGNEIPSGRYVDSAEKTLKLPRSGLLDRFKAIANLIKANRQTAA